MPRGCTQICSLPAKIHINPSTERDEQVSTFGVNEIVHVPRKETVKIDLASDSGLNRETGQRTIVLSTDRQLHSRRSGGFSVNAHSGYRRDRLDTPLLKHVLRNFFPNDNGIEQIDVRTHQLVFRCNNTTNPSVIIEVILEAAKTAGYDVSWPS